MEGSQLYIGTPNGVVICIDEAGDGDFGGRLYHKYSREPVPFRGMGGMIHYMEKLFDELDFPHVATNMRTFAEEGSRRISGRRAEKEKVMSDHELLSQHGYQETFIVRVQHRQNSTWQGRITWADQDKTLTFRSIWEMIHLMESAMTADGSPEEFSDPEPWKDTDA